MNVKSLLLGVFAAVSLAAADVSLKNAVIVHPDTMAGWETSAVGDMKTALEKMTGRTYTVQPESKAPATGVKIYIGNTRAAAAAGIDAGKLEPQEFRMKTGNGSVYLAGGTPTGTSYAVSTFLQECFGVYWLAGDCQVYPANPDPTVPELDKTMKPCITDRTLYNQLDRLLFVPEVRAKWVQFHRINRVSWRAEDRKTPGFRISKLPGGCHSFFRYVPPQKYFKDHPEYYSVNPSGVREWKSRGQLCLTNREVWDVTVKSLIDFIREDRRQNPKNYPTLYDLSQEDNPRFICRCPECQARSKKFGGDFVLINDYVNHVAREIRKIYPDVWLRTFAYCTSEQPLEGVVPEKNVIVRYCDLYTYSNHMYPLTHPVNQERYDLFMKWTKQTPNLALWDYILPTEGQPLTAVDSIIADSRLFREVKLQSIFVETEFSFAKGKFQSFHHLHTFLQAQLLFDPSQDAEKLIEVFMENYYGAAAPEMKQYLAMLRKAQKEKVTPLKDWYERRLAHSTPEFLKSARVLVKQALAKVKNDKTLSSHVAWELINIDKASLRYVRNTPGREAEFKELLKEYRDATLLNLETLHLLPALEKAVKLKIDAEKAVFDTRYTDLPPELANLPQSSFLAVPYIYLKGHIEGKRFKDPESSQPYCLTWKPADARRHKLPVTLGLYARVMCKGITKKIDKAPADEKYHWYKIGTFSLDPNTLMYVNSFNLQLKLNDYYVPADGLDRDPNRYDFWISVRMQGPAYVPGSKKPNGLFLERGLLVKKQ